MGFKIHEVRLGDICAFRAGSAFPRDNQGKTKGDHPFIKVSDMNAPENSWIISRANNWISSSEAHDLKAKLQPKSATVFAKIGEALKADRTRLLSRPTLIDNNMMAAVPKESIDPLYLYYLITSLKLSKWAEGSALPYLKQKVLGDIVVRIPVHVEDQQRTSSILELIDRKIRINQRTNDYLAAIAEGVFEDWLLTAEGEPTPLSRFASFNPSTYSPKEKWPVVAYVDTGSVTRNHFDKPMVIDTATEKLPSRARRKVEDGDVIYSTVRPNQLHYGLVCNPPSNMLVSTGFTVARDSVGVGGPFIYLALTRPSITAKLQSVAEQSTSAYPSIKSSDLEQLEIPMPTKDEIEEIKPQLDSLFAAIAHNEYESKMLEELRDTLLPKLMSGEIDVSQIELPMQPNNHLV